MTDPFEQLKLKYLSSFDDKYLSIKKALSDNDHSALYFIIHQLAGSAGSYGFDEISTVCSALENHLDEKKSIDVLGYQLSERLLELIVQTKA